MFSNYFRLSTYSYTLRKTGFFNGPLRIHWIMYGPLESSRGLLGSLSDRHPSTIHLCTNSSVNPSAIIHSPTKVSVQATHQSFNPVSIHTSMHMSIRQSILHSPTTKVFIHSFIHSLKHMSNSPIHLSIRLSGIYSHTKASINPPIHYSCTHQYICLIASVNPSVHPPFTHQSIHSFTHPSVYPSNIHSFIHQSICPIHPSSHPASIH